MHYSNKKIGLFQATGLAVYVTLLALSFRIISSWLPSMDIGPVAGMILSLLLFVLSALISGSTILGYPLFLFFEGKRREAVSVVLWSVFWLLAFFLTFGAVALAFQFWWS